VHIHLPCKKAEAANNTQRCLAEHEAPAALFLNPAYRGQQLTSCTYRRAISLLSGLRGPALLTHRAQLTCRHQPASNW
jgi:hypothetical protein